MVLYRVIQILPINNHCLLIDFIFKSIYYQKVKRQLTNRFPPHILHCNSKSLYVSVSLPLSIPFWLNDNYCAWQVNSVIYLHTFALTQAQRERETERGAEGYRQKFEKFTRVGKRFAVPFCQVVAEAILFLICFA